mgnify:CR=1 FL=1
MKLTKDFLTANRNEIIEIAKDLMEQNGFEYVTLKDVLIMFSETATDGYTLLDEMQWVIDQLKSKNNASYLVAAEKIQIQSRLNQSINI